MDDSIWGRKRLDTTGRLSTHVRVKVLPLSLFPTSQILKASSEDSLVYICCAGLNRPPPPKMYFLFYLEILILNYLFGCARS